MDLFVWELVQTAHHLPLESPGRDNSAPGDHRVGAPTVGAHAAGDHAAGDPAYPGVAP